MKGWIALDIDGTITAEKHSVPHAVAAYLNSLYEQGWRIVLATGRPLSYAETALTGFGFPFLLIVQNGSAVLEMPESRFVRKNYLNPDLLKIMDEAYLGMGGDYLVYSGFERGDICFFRPDRFRKHEAAYLAELQTRQKGNWQAVKQFNSKEIGFFPLIKCFGLKQEMQEIADRLMKKGVFEVAQIKDPQLETTEILLITAKGVTKGAALQELFEQEGRGNRVIAAGDDANDVSLLAVADTKIAMPHAPELLRNMADRIAPPVEKMGIIRALQEEVGDGN